MTFTLSGPDTHKRKGRPGVPSHQYPGDDRPMFDPSPCRAPKDCELCELPCLTAMGCRLKYCPVWFADEN